jgi:hypothetical protein
LAIANARKKSAVESRQEKGKQKKKRKKEKKKKRKKVVHWQAAFMGSRVLELSSRKSQTCAPSQC